MRCGGDGREARPSIASVQKTEARRPEGSARSKSTWNHRLLSNLKQ